MYVPKTVWQAVEPWPDATPAPKKEPKKKGPQLGENTMALLDYIKANPGRTTYQIAESVRQKQELVSGRVKTLRRNGLVTTKTVMCRETTGYIYFAAETIVKPEPATNQKVGRPLSERAYAIFDYLGKAGGYCTVNEISKAINIPQKIVHPKLVNFERSGRVVSKYVAGINREALGYAVNQNFKEAA